MSAVVVALLLLRRRELLARQAQPRAPGQLREGLRFAWGSPLLRSVLLVNGVVGMLTFNFPAFYSSLVRLTFHANASNFGIAESLNAISAVAGGFVLARRRPGFPPRQRQMRCWRGANSRRDEGRPSPIYHGG